MTSRQIVAIITFMNVHGAENVELTRGSGTITKFTEFTDRARIYSLLAWDDGFTVHYKDGIKHLDNGPAVFSPAGRDEFWSMGIMLSTFEGPRRIMRPYER